MSDLKSCYLSNIIVQRVQRTKLDSESFVNVYQFIRYLSVVFKKNSSVKDLIYPFCLSKCFDRNNEHEAINTILDKISLTVKGHLNLKQWENKQSVVDCFIYQTKNIKYLFLASSSFSH